MKHYRKIIPLFFLSLIIFAACNSEEKKTTPDGVEYILLSSVDGAAFDEGDFVTFSIKMTDANDSVLIDSREVGEMPVQINDSILTIRGSYFSILKGMHVGDSIKTVLSAAEVFTTGFREPVPESMNREDRITIYTKALQKFDSDGFLQYQQEKQQEMITKMEEEAIAQKPLDDQIISDYLAENKIEAQKTASGLYYRINEAGSGEQPVQGDLVKVHYTGTLLDGTLFDTSNEALARENGIYDERNPYKPLEFPIGTNRVIKGWDEGIMLLNKGAKATLYVPSGLAYGARQRSAIITPNTILKFEVELVDIIK